MELNSRDDDVPTGTRLERAFLVTDILIRKFGIKTSGATVAICLIKKSNGGVTINTANAGDARVVLSRGNNAIRLSRDHKADDPEEIERIEKAGGFVFRNRVMGILAVARSLGDQGLKDYVICQPCTNEFHEAKEGDFVILACDGLWDVMSDQEAVNLVTRWKGKQEEVAKQLIDEALKRGSTDNVTVVVSWL